VLNSGNHISGNHFSKGPRPFSSCMRGLMMHSGRNSQRLLVETALVKTALVETTLVLVENTLYFMYERTDDAQWVEFPDIEI
jgi:hypothetical protein